MNQIPEMNNPMPNTTLAFLSQFNGSVSISAEEDALVESFLNNSPIPLSPLTWTSPTSLTPNSDHSDVFSTPSSPLFNTYDITESSSPMFSDLSTFSADGSMTPMATPLLKDEFQSFATDFSTPIDSSMFGLFSNPMFFPQATPNINIPALFAAATQLAVHQHQDLFRAMRPPPPPPRNHYVGRKRKETGMTVIEELSAKRLKNTEAARRSRNRKAERMEELELEIRDLTVSRELLLQEVTDLMNRDNEHLAEIEQLKQALAAAKGE